MKYTFINLKKQLAFLLIMTGILIFGQANGPALEMASGLSNPTTNGPALTTAINFQNNSNNPGGTTFATHLPVLTATYTISNSQYASSVNNSVINIGQNTGGAAPIFDLMNSQGSPADANFTSAGSSTGTGIMGATNRAVRMFIMTYPLRVAGLSPSGTHRMADITVTFNRPVNNPVLHLGALGGTSSTLGFAGRFELIASTGTLSATPLTRLSGNETAGFSVSGNAIFNNATTIAGSGAGSGSGSVMINGTGLTSLTFRVYVRGDGRSGSTSASWATSNTDTTTGEAFTMGFSTLESDIALTKTISNANAAVNGSVNFVVTATNNGPSNNANITIADALPSGYTIGTPTATAGTTYTGGVWTIPTLNAGSSVTLTIPATVNATGNYINVATVTGATVSDSYTANNRATAFRNLDSDNDGVFDTADLDDDNDGIPDALEDNCTKPNRIANGDFASGATSWATGYSTNTPNTTGGITFTTGASGAVDIFVDNPGNLYGNNIIMANAATFDLRSGIYYNFSSTLSAISGTTNTNFSWVLIDASNNVVQTIQSYRTQASGVGNVTITGTATAYPVSFLATQTGTYRLALIWTTNSGTSGNAQDVRIDDVTLFSPCDTDGDGIPNYLDLDSDGDGCYDAIEGDENVLPAHLDSNGRIRTNAAGVANGNSIATVNANGVPQLVNSGGVADIGGTTGQGIGDSQNIAINTQCVDTDSDGIPDNIDLDDDNDGIPDAAECGENNRVIRGNFTGLPSTPGFMDPTQFATATGNNWTFATTGTGISAQILWDNITDAIAFGNGIRFQRDGQTQSITQNISGWTSSGTPQILISKFAANNSNPNGNASTLTLSYAGVEYVRIVTTNGTGTVATLTYSNGASGSVSSMAVGTIYNNWMIYLPSNIPASGALRFDYFAGPADSDDFSIGDVVINACKDTDLDGIPDYLDLDSDGDGCFDAIEGDESVVASQLTGGRINIVANGGVGTIIGTNIGVPNLVNSGGVADSGGDVGQGIGQSQDASKNDCLDSDGDGVPDWLDEDDDNDGILDLVECPNNYIVKPIVTSSITTINTITSGNIQSIANGEGAGGTGNGINPWYTNVGNLPIVVNMNMQAVSTIDHIKLYGPWGAREQMKDFKVELYNASSVLLGTENLTAPDLYSGPITLSFSKEYTNVTRVVFTIISDQGHSTVTPKRVSVTEIVFLDLQICDTDGDGIPNRLDLDSDGDGCSDAFEGAANITTSQLVTAGGTLSGGSTTVNQNLCATGTCVNANGIPQFSTLPTGYNNTTGQGIGQSQDASRNDCIDSDGDGVPDWLDLDDDNDGILDSVECPPVYADYTAATITGAAATTGTVSNIRWGNVTGTLTRAHNGTTSSTGLQLETQNYSNPSVFTPAGSTTQSVLREDISTFNATSNFTRYTLTLSQPVESITLQLANFDYMRTRFTGNHREQLLSGGTELVYDAVTRQLYDTAPNTHSVDTRDGYGSVRITSANGSPITQIIFERFDDPNSANSTDGFYYTFSVEPICDTDGDGIPNRLDLDSDGDGCADAYEGAANITTGQLVTAGGTVSGGSTTVNQNLCATGTCVNANGVPQFSPLPTGYNNTTGQAVGNANDGTRNDCLDADGDGLPDWQDLDDDNDGILDTSECSLDLSTYVTNNFTTVVPAIPGSTSDNTKFLQLRPSDFGLTTAGATNLNASHDYSSFFGLPVGSVIVTVENAHVHPNATSNPASDVFYVSAINGVGSTKVTVSGTVGAYVAIEHGQEYYGLQERGIQFLDGSSINPATNMFNLNTQTTTGNWQSGNNGNYYFVRHTTSSTENAVFGYGLINPQYSPKRLSISTNNIVTNQYSTYFIRILPECDTDADGIPNRLDLDSDGDGCFDAEEGDENVRAHHVNTNGNISTNAAGVANGNNIASVDANGVPLLVNSGGTADTGGDVGQGIGHSQDAQFYGCVCTQNPTLGVPDGFTLVGVSTHQEQITGWPENVGNGFIALDSQSKGMVISRVEHVGGTDGNPLPTDSVVQPIEGMMVYDIQDACVKLFNGTIWRCIERGCNNVVTN